MMNTNTQIINIAFSLLIMMIFCIYGGRCESIVHFRSLSKSEIKNDNIKLLQLIKSKDIVMLKEDLYIDVESWKPVDIEGKRIIGDGNGSKIELYIDNMDSSVSVSLFNNIINCEIYNITIEINSIKNEIEIDRSLINKIEDSKIREFHIVLNKRVILNGDNSLSGLISNEIINSEINDVGIIFNELTIYYLSQSIWCLISCELTNKNRINYNGIFVKGKTLIVIPGGRIISIGLLIYSSTNTNFNYVVVDIENMKIIGNSQFYLSFFIDKSSTDIEINYMMVVIRNKLIYEDETSSFYNMFISGIINEIMVYKTLKLNHYLFDIHVDNVKIDFIEPVNKNMKREYSINGISPSNYGNLIANYVQVKLYFNDMFAGSKNRFCSISLHGIHYCKSVLYARLLVSLNRGDILLNNSYFNIEREIDKDVDNVEMIHHESDGNINVINTYISDPFNILRTTIQGNKGDLINIYSKIKNLNYNRSQSIIYDNSMPFFNYSSNDINYDVFLKVKENERKKENNKINDKSVGANSNKSFILVYLVVMLLLLMPAVVYYTKYNSISYSIINSTENL